MKKNDSRRKNNKQVWQWPQEAPGIVGSGLYDITIMCGPKNMSLEKYNFTKKYKQHGYSYEFLYRVD